MNWENAIKQSEIEAIHGLGPNVFKRWRDKNITRGEDWDKDGKVIYLTVEAYEKYKASISPHKVEESTNDLDRNESETIEMRVVKRARNPRFVMADAGGFCVAVNCKKSESRKMVGKKIKVSVEEREGEKFYSHAR